MWLAHEQGILNLSRASRIFVRQNATGWCVVAHLEGGHYILQEWKMQGEALDHLEKLHARLNRAARA